MGEGGAQDRIDGVPVVEPGEESTHLAIDQRRGGGFIVNPLAAHRAGDDLHRT